MIFINLSDYNWRLCHRALLKLFSFALDILCLDGDDDSDDGDEDDFYDVANSLGKL